MVVCKPGRGSYTESLASLILGFPLSRTMWNKCLLFMSLKKKLQNSIFKRKEYIPIQNTALQLWFFHTVLPYLILTVVSFKGSGPSIISTCCDVATNKKTKLWHGWVTHSGLYARVGTGAPISPSVLIVCSFHRWFTNRTHSWQISALRPTAVSHTLAPFTLCAQRLH